LGEFRSACESVLALAGFDLGKLGCNLEAFDIGKGFDGLSLSFQAKTGAALLLGGDAVVGNERC
jgi:hypothetical protein